MKLICWIALCCSLVVATGCQEANAPKPQPISDDVDQFISSLPDVHSTSTIFAEPDQGFLLFSASYGPPQDCPSGCFYALAFGIEYAGRVGWIYGVPAGTSYYDVRSTDGYLFDESLWNRLSNEWIGGGFRIMIACDADTPVEALERLAVRLPAEGWPFLADLLVDVAQARDARHVAEIVSTLGPSTYNYSYSKTHALAALANWPSQPTGGYCRH